MARLTIALLVLLGLACVHAQTATQSEQQPVEVAQATALNDNLHPGLPPAVITHLKNGEADLDNKVDMAIDAINSHTLSGVATHSPYPTLPPAVVKHLNDFENNLTNHVDVVVNHINALDSKVDLAPAPAPSMHYRRMRA